MEKARPWCGQPSDRGRLKNRTEQNNNKQATNNNCSTELDGTQQSKYLCHKVLIPNPTFQSLITAYMVYCPTTTNLMIYDKIIVSLS